MTQHYEGDIMDKNHQINIDRLEKIADRMFETFDTEIAHDVLAGFGVFLLRIIREKPEARNEILRIVKQVLEIVETASEIMKDDI